MFYILAVLSTFDNFLGKIDWGFLVTKSFDITVEKLAGNQRGRELVTLKFILSQSIRRLHILFRRSQVR